MGELVRANLRFHARRYVATIIAVTIAVAFVAAALVFGSGLNRGITDQVAGKYNGAAAVLAETTEWEQEYVPVDLAAVQEVASNTPGVTEVYPNAFTTVREGAGTRSADPSVESWIPVGTLGGEKLNPPVLEDGSLPTGANQAVVTSEAAKKLELTIGSTITVSNWENDSFELEITGIAQSASGSLALDSSDLLVTPKQMATLDPNLGGYAILVAGENPAPSIEQQEQLVEALEQGLSEASISDVIVTTANQEVEAQLKSIGTSQASLTLMLLLFPIIAATVAMIVVGTTFQVVFKQRERELALLRVIGSTGKQVRWLMILESLAVGLVGSVVGVAIGILGGAAIASAAGVVTSFAVALASVSTVQILLVAVVGVVLTALAGYRPAVKSSRVPPISALSGGVQTVAQMSRKQKAIGVVTGVLTVVIGTLTALRAFEAGDVDQKVANFPVVLLGAVLTVAFLIACLAAVLPLITSSLRGLGSTESFKIAAANTARNPGRTAATGIAVFIGVALISMVTLGAQSLRVTSAASLDSSAPVDMVIAPNSGSLTPVEVEKLSDLEGVEVAVVSEGLEATINQASSPEPIAAVIVVADGVDTVARGDFPDLLDGQVIVPDGSASPGDLVELCADESCRELTVAAGSAISGADRYLVTKATAEHFGADLSPVRAWLKLDNPDDFPEVLSSIQDLGPELQIEGAVALRAAIDQIVNVLVMVVVALLGVSVLVSLVGITNTLSLSVTERMRENGLLRALGMTRRQVRSMLSWEALLIGVASTVLGLGAGAYFGVVGFMALPVGVEQYIVSVPWLQWLAVVVVAVGAAWLASVVPGRRASKVSPVEALASE